MEGPRVALLVFLLLFILVSPDSPRASSPHQQQEYKLLLEKEHYALDALKRHYYGDFDPEHGKWLNVTGFREEDNYAWDLLPKVQARVQDQIRAILEPWKQYDLGSRYSSADSFDGAIESLPAGTDTAAVAVPFYQNVTGLVHGKWIRSAVTQGHQAPLLNLTALSPDIQFSGREYNRNITGVGGDMSFRFDEKKSTVTRKSSNSAREIKAEMTIKDETSSGDGWEVVLYGVHFPESGSILLSTTGDRFAGIFALPQLARSSVTSELSKELLNRTLLASISRQEGSSTTSSYPWASIPNSPAEALFPTPHCEFVVYLQQNIIWPHSSFPPYQGHSGFPTHLERVEQELRYPTGASFEVVRNMEFSAVIYSPDCGLVLESKGPPDFSLEEGVHLRGPKAEYFYKEIRHIVQLLSLLIGAQIYFLVRQMKDASTPSTRSRISFYTIAMMALGDGFICLSFMTITLFLDAVFLLIVTTAFLAFLCVSFFGMKFLIDIWTVQAPERLERQRERDRRRQEANANPNPETTSTSAPSVAPIISAAGVDTLPLPVTARQPRDTGATPVLLPPDQDIEADAAEENATVTAATGQNAGQTTIGSTRRDMGTMYSRFYFVLIGILFLSLNATTWPTSLRSIYTNTLAAIYLSFWVPQITRNVIRNCRKALRWEFVLGQSILRLVPFFYFYTYHDNVLFTTLDWPSMYALTGWVWLQVLALISQEILGPRFFVPDGWAPPAYDYHPLLREADEESGAANMPIGFTQATTSRGDLSAKSPGPWKEQGKRIFDCAICMQDIDVPVVPISNTNNSNINYPESGGGAGDHGGSGSTSEALSGAASSLGANLFARRAYMVTPCRHIFHSACLEGWMRYKLQCPICRDSLPPL